MNESYTEWENAETKCQSLGARLPVLDTKETIDIVKSYLHNIGHEGHQSSRRVWLGLIFNRGSGIVKNTFQQCSDPDNPGWTWADGQKVIAYPASSRLFVWESRRLLSDEVS